MVSNYIHRLLSLLYPMLKYLMPYQVFAYLAVGAANTLFNIGLFILVYQVLTPFVLSVEIASLVSFSLSVISGFWLHKTFAFANAGKQKKEVQKQFGKYGLVALQGQVSAYLLTKAMIELAGSDARIAYVLTAIIMLTINYFLQKYFTFRSNSVSAQ